MSSNEKQHIGDKVGGDKNSVGSINTSGSTAMGAGASATTNNYYGVSAQHAMDTRLDRYREKITELLLTPKQVSWWGRSKAQAERAQAQKVASMLTVTTIQELDAKHNSALLKFLYNADLLNKIVSLEKTNLSGADLSGADLSGADLSGADLSGADLSGADLSGADLSGADLSGADLTVVKLYGADLQGAKLSGANLQGANLERAKLQKAKLQKANLQGAKLQRSDLSGADLQGAKLQGANLYGTILFLGFPGIDLTVAFLDETTTLPDGSKWTSDTDLSAFTRS
jgi:uncharacterized protein YjbI with pentapeptide repeats